MKKFLCFAVIICTLISVSGCQYALERKKNQYNEIYHDEENYITFTGKITEFVTKVGSDGQLVKIECSDLLNHVSDEEYKRIYYRVLSDQPLDLEIGDTITFVTVPKDLKNSYCLPIVFVCKDDIILLELEEGKENLFDWVDQLQLK